MVGATTAGLRLGLRENLSQFLLLVGQSTRCLGQTLGNTDPKRDRSTVFADNNARTKMRIPKVQ